MTSSSGRRSNPTILPRPDGRIRSHSSHRPLRQMLATRRQRGPQLVVAIALAPLAMLHEQKRAERPVPPTFERRRCICRDCGRVDKRRPEHPRRGSFGQRNALFDGVESADSFLDRGIEAEAPPVDGSRATRAISPTPGVGPTACGVPGETAVASSIPRPSPTQARTARRLNPMRGPSPSHHRHLCRHRRRLSRVDAAPCAPVFAR